MDIFHRLFTGTSLASKGTLAIIGFFAVGLIFLVYGLLSLLGTSSSDKSVVFEEASSVGASTSANMGKIVVDIEGAVEKPGVYELPNDARIQDAMVLAGGLGKDANREWVSRNLNLAAKLRDGGKLYIPSVGEDITTSTISNGNMGSDRDAGALGESSALININTSSQSELESLPGIGPVTAGKIINGRPYGDISELLSKKVVGNATFEKIKDLITIL